MTLLTGKKARYGIRSTLGLWALNASIRPMSLFGDQRFVEKVDWLEQKKQALRERASIRKALLVSRLQLTLGGVDKERTGSHIEMCLERGYKCEALAYARFFHAAFPEEVVGTVWMAQLLYEHNRFTLAETFLRKGLEKEPENEVLLELAAKIYHLLRCHKISAKMQYQSILINPAPPVKLNRLYMRLNSHELVPWFVESVLQPDQENVDPVLWRRLMCEAHIVLGDLDEAEKHFREIEKSSYQDVEVDLLGARVLFESGHPLEAEKYAQKVLKAAPNSVSALLIMGAIEINEKRFSEALPHYLKVLDHKPDSLLALRRVVRIYANTNQLPLAKPYCRKIVDITKDYADYRSYFEIFRVGNKKKVVSRFIDYLDYLKDKGEISELEFANALVAARYYFRAERMLMELPKEGPRTHEIQKNLMNLYFSTGDYLKAGKIHRELMSVGQTVPLSPLKENRLRVANEMARQLDLNEESHFSEEIVKSYLERVAKIPGKARSKQDSLNVTMVLNSLGHGGSERQLVNTAIELKSRYADKVNITMLVDSLAKENQRDFFLPQLQAAGIPVRLISDFSEREMATGWDPIYENYFEAFEEVTHIKRVGALYRGFTHLKPDIIHSRGGMAVAVALASAIYPNQSTILHFGSMTRKNQSDGSEEFSFRDGISKKIYSELYHCGLVRFAINSRAAQEDWAQFLEVPVEALKVIYNGIHLSALKAQKGGQSVREKLGIPLSAPVVGSVGRLHKVKNPQLFLRIAEQLKVRCPEVHFLVVGDGPLRKNMEMKTDALDMKGCIHFAGAVFDGLADYYDAMNLVLLTSKTESLPNVLIEAQALGCPVVATDVGGVRETFLENETGWAFAPEQESAFVDRIEQILKRENSEVFSEKAKSYVVEKFSIAGMAEETFNTYREELRPPVLN